MKDKSSSSPVESKPIPNLWNKPNVRNSRLDDFMELLSRFEGCGFRRTLKGSRVDNLTPIKLHLTTIDHVLDSLEHSKKEQQIPVPNGQQMSSSNSSGGIFGNSRTLLSWWLSMEESLQRIMSEGGV